MPATNVRGGQVKDGSIQRADLDIATVGSSVVRRLVAGTSIGFSSTGADTGTGDVTVNLTSHDNTLHTDTVRYFWLSRDDLPSADAGTPSVQGAATPNQVSTWLLADAATQGMFGQFTMPWDTVANTNISIAILCGPVTTVAGATAVRWSINALKLAAGVDSGAAGTTTTFTGSNAARTLRIMWLETETQILTGLTAGDLVRLNVRRVGADAADTYTGGVHVVGIRVTYTAEN